jgi:hypothetical protein
VDPLEEQQALAESSLELVFETYDLAVADKLRQPIVVLVDCEDALGSQFARAWMGDEAVDNAIAQARLDEEAQFDEETQTTVFARPVTWADAKRELPPAFPYLAEVFQANYPADGILVVAIAAGGACALTAPWDARP